MVGYEGSGLQVATPTHMRPCPARTAELVSSHLTTAERLALHVEPGCEPLQAA